MLSKVLKLFLPIIIVFIALYFYSCSQQKMDEDTVAIVGKDKISKSDLLVSYELLPYYASSKKGVDGLQAHLEMLSEKKMFAQEGRRRGYAKDPVVKRAARYYENEALRTALYQDEIENKIEVTDEELLDFYKNQNTQVRVKHLFAKTQEQIDRIQYALNNDVSWEELARFTFRDSALANSGGDLGWIGYGEMDEAFEDAAFNLEMGEISEPVRSKFGYHLIKLENVRRNIMQSMDDFVLRKDNLEAAYVKREEKNRSSQFIKEFMQKKDLKMINETFDILVKFIGESIISAQMNEPEFRPNIRDDELNTLMNDLEPYYDEVLLTFNNGEWTIKDLVDYIRILPETNRPHIDNPRTFRRELGIMMRDHFLNEEARRRGLQDDPYVIKERKHWEDEFIFSRFWNDIINSIEIPETQAVDYYELHKSRYWIPEKVHVQEILVKTRQHALDLIRKLEEGEDFTALAKQHSLRPSANENGGDLGFLVWGQLGQISKTAFNMKTGKYSEPLKLDGGYSIIKVLGREKQRDKTFEEARDDVYADLRHELNNKVYDEWVEKLKEKTEIVKNDTLLVTIGEELEEQQKIVMPGTKRMR